MTFPPKVFYCSHRAGFLTRPLLPMPSRCDGRSSGVASAKVAKDLQQRGLLPAFTAFPFLMRVQI